MKKFLLLSLFFGAINIFAQHQQDSILAREIPTIISIVDQQRQKIITLTKQFKSQNYSIKEQSENISILQDENTRLNTSIDSLILLIETNRLDISTNSEELGIEISETRRKANNEISELDKSVEKNRFYWIVATLTTLLLGGLVYWLLGKQITSSKTDVETQIRNTKASLEEESVKLDSKLIEVLDTQLKLQQETAKAQLVASNKKEDHSLALKVADEMVRMQRNISKIGSETKGLKPLLKGIERIQNNFAANGYEMINHLNKAYDERFNIDVINFITDENLDKGIRVITAIIKPQVNYKSVLIQRAQVDVSQN